MGEFSTRWGLRAPPLGGQGITIPDSGVGIPYPSECFIPYPPNSVIADVNLHLWGLTHTFPDDLDLLLVGPGGENAIVMSDAGGGSAVSNLDLVLDDEAGEPLPDETELVNGSSYQPFNYSAGDPFPAPHRPRAAAVRSRSSTGQPRTESGGSTWSTMPPAIWGHSSDGA